MIRAASSGSSIFERHSLRRFAALAYRSHRRTRSHDGPDVRYDGQHDDQRTHNGRYDYQRTDDGRHHHGVNYDMSAFDGQHASALHLKRNGLEDEREALMMLLDFLLGSSIDDIAASRRSASRADVEEALRSVLLEYGFTASRERRS